MRSILRISVIALFLSSVATAGNLPSVTNTFGSGTPARASEVNQNFEDVRAEVDDNANNITSNTSNITANEGNITNNSNGIANAAGNISALALLHYPHILNATGALIISSSVGMVSYVGGDDALIAGRQITLPVFTSSAILASSTYHLRYDNTQGWTLNNLTDISYNPGTLVESDQSFDSSNSSMLVARVVTDAGNIPSVISLTNRNRLQFTLTSYVGCVSLPAADDIYHVTADSQTTYGTLSNSFRELRLESIGYFSSRQTVNLNWARTPQAVSYSHNMGYFNNNTGNRQFDETITGNNRYTIVTLSKWALLTPGGCLDLSVIVSGVN